jgi:hypothetical protein
VVEAFTTADIFTKVPIDLLGVEVLGTVETEIDPDKLFGAILMIVLSP